jgi:2-polyprenyl-6-methoxyphenol hydroxylase-like FAD-dependent oxidoreductase
MITGSHSNKSIVILGGGTAGWMTANAMIDRWAGNGVSLSLVESPDIGTVGVGEGSTPRLKQFFDAIGIRESEWMPKCNATYKNGISFANWSTKVGAIHRRSAAPVAPSAACRGRARVRMPSPECRPGKSAA